MTTVVLVPWTYDNIGSSMKDSSVLVNLPYEFFAHTVGTDSTVVETFSVSDEIDSIDLDVLVEEPIRINTESVAHPVISTYTPMFVSDKLDGPSVGMSETETITLGETTLPSPKMFDHRFLSVYDTYAVSDNGEDTEITNAEREPVTILCDVELSYAPEYHDQFVTYANHKSPVGYSTLRPLYPGDYEYQDAIVGIQVDLKPPVSGRFGVAGATLHIDVQDVVDKGTEIFDENRPYQGRTRVWFTKKFYSRPNVFTEVRNANPPCRVNVLAVDTRGIGSDSSHAYGYFDFELLNFTDGTDWSGDVTIAWNAIGY